MKVDFKPYPVGKVFNPLQIDLSQVKLKHRRVIVKFPSRLNAMAIDPSKITSNKNLIYTPGEVLFCVGIYKTVNIQITNKPDEITISNRTNRKGLVKHACLIMKIALKSHQGFSIDVDNELELKHCGLGSSSSLIAAVSSAINELYGNPISKERLVKYVAQNHGEELDNKPNDLNPIQCIGGSAAAGMYQGGIFVIAGESQVIASNNIDNKYQVIIGIPEKYKEEDSKAQFDKEKLNFAKFLKTGKKYGPILAYRILHQGIPDLFLGNLEIMGDIIYDYRFDMGSIRNCSYVYPPIIKIAKKIAVLKKDGTAPVLALSSVGPAFFAITTKPDICSTVFEAAGLRVFKTKIENKPYQILEKS